MSREVVGLRDMPGKTLQSVDPMLGWAAELTERINVSRETPRLSIDGWYG